MRWRRGAEQETQRSEDDGGARPATAPVTTAGRPADVLVDPAAPSFVAELRAAREEWRADVADGVRDATRRLTRRLVAYRLAASHGLEVPAVHAVWDDVADLSLDGLPARVVLRPDGGSSGRTVFVVRQGAGGEVTVEGRDDAASLAEVGSRLLEHRSAGRAFFPVLAEEVLEGAADGPAEVRVHAFHGSVGLVVLHGPAREAGGARRRYLDGDGRDLATVPGHDPELAAPEWLPALVEGAARLSTTCGRPFVRVDVRATTRGPVVVGLEPLPEGRQWFGAEVDERLGRLWGDARRALDREAGSPRHRPTAGPRPVPSALAAVPGGIRGGSFDVGSDTSPFFAFVAGEFVKRGTEQRRLLSLKEHAGEVATAHGIRGPERYGIVDDVAGLRALQVPDRFVLKYSVGWSARGVMLLERTGEDGYFDHLSQREMTTADLVERQGRVAESFGETRRPWIVEEWLPPITPGPIPFDYKFYCFRDRVGMVVQIDRNTYPVKIALFDGEWHPLVAGTDYRLVGKAQDGIHLLPRHPLQLLHHASTLSAMTDSPFVSIDLFDTPAGPRFGEFTFSPGGTHRRMWEKSAELISHLDALFEQREPAPPSWRTAEGSLDVRGVPLDVLREAESLPEAAYRAWSAYHYNGGRRAAERTAECLRQTGIQKANHPTVSLATRWDAAGRVR